jgi:Flp pilus assembly protein TadG
MSLRCSLLALGALAAAALAVHAQSTDDTIRVTVTVNADGSRTTYQFDNSKHEAIATTADSDGKARGKVVYRLDNAGRFESGIVYGPQDKFLFKTTYKYDAAGRLQEETHLDKGDSVVNRTLYKYDSAGKQTGYSVFDATGKLISGAAATPGPTAPKSKNTLGR